MRNSDIREEIADNWVKYWQVAEVLGLSDGGFSRLLRHELSEEKKAEIRTAIKKAKKIML